MPHLDRACEPTAIDRARVGTRRHLDASHIGRIRSDCWNRAIVLAYSSCQNVDGRCRTMYRWRCLSMMSEIWQSSCIVGHGLAYMTYICLLTDIFIFFPNLPPIFSSSLAPLRLR